MPPFYQPPPPVLHSSASQHGPRASHHVPSASQELSHQASAQNPSVLQQPCLHTDRPVGTQWQPVTRDQSISTNTTYRATPATVISSSTPSPETISSVDTSSDVLPGIAADISSTSEELCRPSAVFSLEQSYRKARISRQSPTDSPPLQGEVKGSSRRHSVGPMGSEFTTKPRVNAMYLGAGDPPLGPTEQGLGASVMMHGANRSKMESMLGTVGGTKLNTCLSGPTESEEGSQGNTGPGSTFLLQSVQPTASVKAGAERATAPDVPADVGSSSKTGSAKSGTFARAEQSVRPKVKARVAEIERKTNKSKKTPAKFDYRKSDSRRAGTGLPPDDHPIRGPTMLDMLGTDTKLAGISSILNDKAFSIFENTPAPLTGSVLSTAHVALHDKIMESVDRTKKFLVLSPPRASGNNDRSSLPSRRLPTGKENFEPADDTCSIISLPEPDAISRNYLFEFGQCIRKLGRKKRPMATQFELNIPDVGDVAGSDILVLDDATRNSKLSLELEQIIGQLRLGQLGECFATSERTHADNPEVISRARKRCDDILEHHTKRNVLEFFFKSGKFEEDVKAIRFLSLLYEWALIQLPESDVEKITLRYQYETTILSHSPTAEMNFKNVIDMVHDCRAVDCQEFSQRAVQWKMESLLCEMTLKMPPPDAQQRCRRLLFFSTLLDSIAVLNAFVRLKRFNWDD